MPTKKKERTIAGKAIRAQSARFVNGKDIVKRIPHVAAMALARAYMRNLHLSPITVDTLSVNPKGYFTAAFSQYCACCGPRNVLFTWHEKGAPVACFEYDSYRADLHIRPKVSLA